MKLCEC